MAFGISLGGGKTKGSSTSTGTFDKTSMPVAPPWVAGLSEQFGGMLGNLAGQNPHSLVPGGNSVLDAATRSVLGLGGYKGPDFLGYGAANADVGMAWDTMSPETKAAMGLNSAEDYYRYHYNTFGKDEGRALPTFSGGGDPLWDKAEGALDGLSAAQAEFVSGLKYLPDWLNPYREQVVDVLSESLDHERGRQEAEMNRSLAGRDAFSGSGAALSVANTKAALDRAKNEAITAALDQMFNKSAGYALTDAGNENQVNMTNAQLGTQAAIARAQGLGSLASNKGQYQLGAAELQGQFGDFLRGIEKEQALAPYAHLDAILSMFSGGFPWEALVGEHSIGTETTNSKSKGSNFGFNVGFKYGE